MVLLVAFFLRKGFPRLSAVVKAPVADKVHAPKQVIKVKGGAGGVGVVLLPFKPVHFHAEQNAAGAIGVGGFDGANLAHVVRQVAGQLLAVFVCVVKANGPGRMLGKAHVF